MTGAIPPEVTPDPADWRGFVLRIPDTQEWRGLVTGALLYLSFGYYWDRKKEHWAEAVEAGKRIVLNWLEEIDAMGNVRQNPDAPCELQKTTDGVTWDTWANLQLCPPHVRFDNGRLQYYDGTHWIDVPGANDERETGTYTPPWPSESLPPGQTGQCLSATNIVAEYLSEWNQVKAFFDGGALATTATAFIMGVVGLFIPVAEVAEEFIGAMAAFFAAGATAVDDMVTVATIAVLKCALAEHGQDDGSFTDANLTDIGEYIETHISVDLTKAMMELWLDLLGPVGLSRMGKAAGLDSGDCSDCEGWTFEVDFTASNGGFVSGGSGFNSAAWTGGIGWHGDYAVYEMRFDFYALHDAHVNHVEIDFVTDGTYNDGNCAHSLIELDTFAGTKCTQCSTVHEPSGTYTCDDGFDWVTGQNISIPVVASDATYIHITRFKAHGAAGANPFV